MQTEIDTLKLQPGTPVYFLGILSSIIGYRTNPTAGWGTILEVQPAKTGKVLSYIVDMGEKYCNASERIKKVPHYLFGPQLGQMFLTPEQMKAEMERQEKNHQLNEFYKRLDRKPLNDIIQ